MDAIELLNKIGINREGTYSNNDSYIVDLKDSNDFGRIYSKLENSNDLDLQEDTLLLTIHNSSIEYRYEGTFQLVLKADWDNDAYELVVSEL